jgi:hypothetical protein
MHQIVQLCLMLPVRPAQNALSKLRKSMLGIQIRSSTIWECRWAQEMGFAGANEPCLCAVSSYNDGRVSAVVFDFEGSRGLFFEAGVSSFRRPFCSMCLRWK